MSPVMSPEVDVKAREQAAREGIEVRGPHVEGEERVLTLPALRFVASLAGLFEPRRRALLEKRRQMKRDPSSVRFDRMTPIVKEPFTPDDDAIVATNGLEMRFFLERFGCEVARVECTDRYVPRLADWILNATSLRFLMFNAFVVGRRREGSVRS